MAKELEPTPDDRRERDSSAGDMQTILKNLPQSSSGARQGPAVVTPDVYEKLMSDHPLKFSEDQVGFVRGGGSDKGSCGGCVHFYVSEVAKRKVCEIFRPKDESNIEPEDVCRFFTTDGKTFPLLGQKLTTKEKSPEA